MLKYKKYPPKKVGDSMNVETIMKFFYKKASDRIKEKVKSSNKTYAQIYKTDTKLISRIVNNKITRVNPFFIPDAVISSSVKEETSNNYIEIGLLHTLKFNSIKEILWGSDEEVKSYLPELFKLLWDELTEDDLKIQCSKDFILCDYIPYAENRAYFNLLVTLKNIFSAEYTGSFLELYGRSEDVIINDFDSVEKDAVAYLYFKCKDDFEKLFEEFCSKTDSFHKIDKVIKNEFLDTVFIDLIKQNIPNEHSLGIRVKTIIESDLSQSAELIIKYKETQQIDEIKKKLINASSTYAVMLKEIQIDMIKNSNI